METLAWTGCRIRGDFSASIVSVPGTAGDSPAAMIRISSGVTAANACGTRRIAAATGPHRPYSAEREASERE
jgi:hypothetical protein